MARPKKTTPGKTMTGPTTKTTPREDDDRDDDEDDEVDERVLDQARDLALRHPHLSPSFLERRLKVGGWRAAQILGLLEDEGLIVNR